MLIEANKNQLPSTSESFYTPSKGKNPSSIETNPSANFVNSLSPINLVSPFLNSSSVNSYQYSGIQFSQSLNVSPSFMSPNKEIGSILMTPYQSSLQYQFKTQQSRLKNQQSQLRLKTESFIKVKMLDEISESDKSQKKKVSHSEIRELLKMVQKVRLQKIKKQQISRKLNHKIILNQHLTNMINEKQQKLLYHKNQVQKRVQKKNELTKKIKDKKIKLKLQQQSQLSRLRTKSTQMSEEFHIAQKKIQFQLKHIEMLQRQKQSYQQLLRQRSISQQYYAQNYQHSYQYAYPSYQQFQSQPFSFQNPEQMNYSKQFSSTKRVNFKDTPDSSQPNSARSKKNSNRNSKTKYQLPILQVLRSHFIKKFHQENQHGNNQRKDGNNNQKNVMLKKALEQMIESLSQRQNSPRPSFRSGDKSETQSQIAIDCESLQNYSDYKIKQSQFYTGRKRRSVDHSPSQKDHVNVSQKKLGGAAKQFLQSIVNIMCETSQFSDAYNRNHEFFSPRPDTSEENKKRKRSPTQQFLPKVKPKTFENVQSEVKFNESQRKSGDQTPVFRSQNSESENDVRFSQMLLASLRNQNHQCEQLGHSQTSESGNINQSLKNSVRKTQEKHNHQGKLIKIQEDMEYSNNKKANKQIAFNTIRNESEEPQEIQIIDEDDEFFSCTLNTQSRIVIQSKNSSAKPSITENKYSKSMKSQHQDQEDFQKFARTENSYIQKNQTKSKNKKKIQQKRSSLDLTRNQKISYNFQTVPEEDQALQQDTKSLIYKKLNSKKYSKTTL